MNTATLSNPAAPATAATGVSLPDVTASTHAAVGGTLDGVGMSGLALPFVVAEADRGDLAVQGTASIHVNLRDPHAKGIHMSRLYLLLEDFAQGSVVTPGSLERLLQQALQSHQEISDTASLALRFQYLSRRPALASDNRGWKAYPVTLGARLEQGRSVTELCLSVPYSSTCPCSASLSRQLIAQAFHRVFQDRANLSVDEVGDWLQTRGGSWATPHSQRSFASIRVRLGAMSAFALEALIGIVEGALQTPVQTAVKREDEQAFALLNGQNLMFCEDAARRIKAVLNRTAWIEDFEIRVEHQESLHAHDAVAMVVKGIAGGYAPGGFGAG
ncbi:GTP cyclohydrolase FolE2 [Marinobacterium rhizophilum]|uniref:GTP cyclohydrolase FolE2 n=1 Tax=Marinobacterium rhizophilum TaxID=420402 RepID=A0ABY5HMG8_9GAMM|nr:GTP cyclohydrolase FolE2 [Marinobacterium rhizophilum]UTW13076.1 GTP cyclohydrolase I FolE2 [Marinobacterium rhizophilum]